MEQHLPPPPAPIGSGCWLNPPLHMWAARQSLLVFLCVRACVRARVCVRVPRGVGVCQKACNTQVLDWFEPCRSVTLIVRVQAKDEKMHTHTHTHTFVIRLFWMRWCHFCCCFCRPPPRPWVSTSCDCETRPLACIGVQGRRVSEPQRRRTLHVERTSARGSEPREEPLNHRSNETFCPVWAGASHL